MGYKTVSPSGRRKLYGREGCPLKAYRDSQGIPTIGCGHTGRASLPLVRMGMTITQAQADAMFLTDIAPLEAVINRRVRVPITQNMFDALVSLGHNIGWPGLQGSSVIHKLNHGDYQGAAHAFLMWDSPAELFGRRTDEMRQFLGHDAEPTEAPLPPTVKLPSGRVVASSILVPAQPAPGTIPVLLAHETPPDAPHEDGIGDYIRRWF